MNLNCLYVRGLIVIKFYSLAILWSRQIRCPFAKSLRGFSEVKPEKLVNRLKRSTLLKLRLLLSLCLTFSPYGLYLNTKSRIMVNATLAPRRVTKRNIKLLIIASWMYKKNKKLILLLLMKFTYYHYDWVLSLEFIFSFRVIISKFKTSTIPILNFC